MFSSWNGAYFGICEPEGETYALLLRLRIDLQDEARDQTISGDLWTRIQDGRTYYHASFVTTRVLTVEVIGSKEPRDAVRQAALGIAEVSASVALLPDYEVGGAPPDFAGHCISGDAVMTPNGWGERIRFRLYLPGNGGTAGDPIFHSRIWNAEPDRTRARAESDFTLRPDSAIREDGQRTFRRFRAVAAIFGDVTPERASHWKEIFEAGAQSATDPVSTKGRATSRTVESVLAQAGLRLDLHHLAPQPAPPGDEALDERDRGWDDDDLTTRMEEVLKQHDAARPVRARPGEPAPPPSFAVLACGRYAPDPDVTGLMFAVKETSMRRGAAMFLHYDGAGVLQPADRRRKDLWTCVHEIGHVFNLLHSFEADHSEVTPGPARADFLTFMNYPSRFPLGSDAPDNDDWKTVARGLYWRDFDYSFDRTELRHLRHGALADVEVGGRIEKFMAAGSQPRAADEKSPVDGLSLTLILPRRIQFLEPLIGYFRLRNHRNPAVLIHHRICTANRTLAIEIEHRGRRTLYTHFRTQCELADEDASPAVQWLRAAGTYYGEVRPSCGASWLIAAPGRYRLRLRYQTPRGLHLASPWRDVLVERPDPSLERLAPDYFTPAMSMFLAHDGSRSWLERPEIKRAIDRAKALCPNSAIGELLARLELVSLSDRSQLHRFDPKTALPAAVALSERLRDAKTKWTKVAAFQLRIQSTRAIRGLARCRKVEYEADGAAEAIDRTYGHMMRKLRRLNAPPRAWEEIGGQMQQWRQA